MNSEQEPKSAPPDREAELFASALEKTGTEREAFLQSVGAEDPALRSRLEALLAAHEQEDGVLAEPAEPVRRAGKPEFPDPSPDEAVGQTVGRYKLLQQIGEGGCGVVYMAEQAEPIRRRVALKVIKVGMDTKRVIARFEAERQALALMDHPNIAKVLDAGTTETGRPFFVMELVRGIKITDYCDENRLSTEERLKLFVEVCHAIQHAHQKGIIHRDIKPSNILITINDGVLVPKVIDFGIAKATGGQVLTDKTVFTAFEQFIGTPAYMSPEQAVMTSLDIDTRSDIYALGVLLYELLTGHTPFDQKELVAAGLDEMRRIIREKEPARPSTRVSTLGEAEQTTVAQRRQAELPQLIHLLCGDLDWIVMKCLEKDRSRRYETANGLAADVLRHLDSEPIAARPPNRLYRFHRLVRRNKLVFAAAGAVAAALVLGLGISTWLLFKERAAYQRAIAAEKVQSQLRQQAETARQRAEAGERKAQIEASKSDQAAEFLERMLESVEPSVALGRDTKMLKEVLDKTAERVGKDLRDQPEVEAQLRSVIGNTYLAMGDFPRAEAMHREALRLRQALFGETNASVALSYAAVANALRRQRRPVEAETACREALAIWRELGGEHPDLAEALDLFAWLHLVRGSLDEAETLGRQALAMKRRLLGDEDAAVAVSLSNVGEVLRAQGKLLQAETMFRESLAMKRKLLGTEHPSVANTVNLLGGVLLAEGKLDEAETAYREALAIRKKLLGTEHRDVTDSLNDLLTVLMRERKYDQADQVLDDILTLALDRGPQSARLRRIRAEFLAGRGRWKEAASDATQALELQPTDHVPYHTLAPLLVAIGNLEKYREHCRKTLMQFSGTANPYVADRMAKDCLILSSAGCDLEGVGKLAETAVRLGTNENALPYFECTKGLAEYRLGRFTNAVDWAQKSIDNPSYSGDPNRFVQAYMIIAMAQHQLKHNEPARAAMEQGAEIAAKKLAEPGSGEVGSGWRDWIIAQALLQEANALIDREHPPQQSDASHSPEHGNGQ